MARERRTGHARAPRMSAALRKALDAAESQADAPIKLRLEALRIPDRDHAALIERLHGSPIIEPAGTGALEVLDMVARDPEDEDSERTAAVLHALQEIDGASAVIAELLHTCAVLAVMEGMVLGVVYAIMRDEADDRAMKSRPRR